jgi:FMN-dependent NADH-azoreductase
MTEKKQIFAISASPSKGRNSDTMLDKFIEGAQKVEGIEIEKVYLNDIQIDNYTYENGQCPQPHEEEFAKLVDKINVCEGLVIATPTYNFSVPAGLKNFIDRSRCIALDMEKKNWLGQPVGKMGNIRAYFLVSGGTPVWAQKLLFFAFPPFWLRSVFLYFGANVIGAFYTGDTKAFQNEKILNKCIIKGINFGRDVMKRKTNNVPERIFWRPPQK